MTSWRTCALIAALVATAATAAPARRALADDIPGHRISRPINGLVIAGALGFGFGFSVIELRERGGRWQREVFGGADRLVHRNFSRPAMVTSDVGLVSSVAVPALYLVGTSIEEADGDRMLLYTEALTINFALFQGAKRLVQRPRPYLYSTVPGVVLYARDQGDDAQLSFYSGHAATAFCAATAGAYLRAASGASGRERVLAWAGGFAIAGATANLRVRAGKHFYSDVAIGATVGIALGYLVPALHADAGRYVPDAADIGAAAAGLVAGALVSQLVPLGAPAPGPPGSSSTSSLHVGLLALPGGVGVAIGGAL